MDLPLKTDNSLDRKGEKLPSLDDYMSTGVTITQFDNNNNNQSAQMYASTPSTKIFNNQ